MNISAPSKVYCASFHLMSSYLRTSHEIALCIPKSNSLSQPLCISNSDERIIYATNLSKTWAQEWATVMTREETPCSIGTHINNRQDVDQIRVSQKESMLEPLSSKARAASSWLMP